MELSIQTPLSDGGSLASLPVDWLSQVFFFLDIKQVFECLRVNRWWNAAAKLSLRRRKALALVRCSRAPVMPGISRLDTLILYHKPHLVLRCLKHFMNLKRLDVILRRDAALDDLILRNSQSLTHLWVLELPSTTVYQRLGSLRCRRLPPEAAAASPVLRHLTLFSLDSVSTLERLPLECLQSLEVHVLFPPSLPFGDLVQGILRLQSLQRLCLRIRTLNGWHDDVLPGVLLPLLRGFARLTAFTITANYPPFVFRDVNVDHEIASLVIHNPRLDSFDLNIMKMTDAALELLSQLTDLTRVNVTGGNEVTTEGILWLLRGSARDKLSSIAIRSNRQLEWRLLHQEVGVMARDSRREVIMRDSASLNVYGGCFRFERSRDAYHLL